jgi:hypothetical protein
MKFGKTVCYYMNISLFNFSIGRHSQGVDLASPQAVARPSVSRTGAALSPIANQRAERKGENSVP